MIVKLFKGDAAVNGCGLVMMKHICIVVWKQACEILDDGFRNIKADRS